MVVKEIINSMLPSIWPLIFFISVVAITLRITYLMKSGKKFILYKELLSLVFIIYIICLYYIFTKNDTGGGGFNIIPFKEMFRYKFGTYKFWKNIIGNILIFVPLGYFSSYFINNKKISYNIIPALIISASVEGMQYYIGRSFDIDDIILNVLGSFCGLLIYVALRAIKERLPKFMRSDGFINFIIILIIILSIFFSFKLDILKYL